MKPKVICHMMSSVDGRLVADRFTPSFDGTEQDKIYEPCWEMEKELGIGAWMNGNNTIIEYKGEANEQPAKQALELLSVKELKDGIVWLHYKFHRI